MNEYYTLIRAHERFRGVNKNEPKGWPISERGVSGPKSWRVFHFCEQDLVQIPQNASNTFDADWAKDVPELIKRMVALAQDKKQRELEFNLIQIAINNLEQRMQRLESIRTRIIPIDSFAPEPYKLLKPILVSVQCVDDEFEASWFDANIHFAGRNEEEAVRNLKGLILDCLDSFDSKSPEKLGPEPTRQLAVLRDYITKAP